ncbi:hypothetical protein [Streptomyces sp. NPDC088766]
MEKAAEVIASSCLEAGDLVRIGDGRSPTGGGNGVNGRAFAMP